MGTAARRRSSPEAAPALRGYGGRGASSLDWEQGEGCLEDTLAALRNCLVLRTMQSSWGEQGPVPARGSQAARWGPEAEGHALRLRPVRGGGRCGSGKSALEGPLHSHRNPTVAYGRIECPRSRAGVRGKGGGRATGRPLLGPPPTSRGRAPGARRSGGCFGDVRGAALRASRAGLHVRARRRGHSLPLPRPQPKTEALPQRRPFWDP